MVALPLPAAVAVTDAPLAGTLTAAALSDVHVTAALGSAAPAASRTTAVSVRVSPMDAIAPVADALTVTDAGTAAVGGGCPTPPSSPPPHPHTNAAAHNPVTIRIRSPRLDVDPLELGTRHSALGTRHSALGTSNKASHAELL